MPKPSRENRTDEMKETQSSELENHETEIEKTGIRKPDRHRKNVPKIRASQLPDKDYILLQVIKANEMISRICARGACPQRKY